MHKISHFNAVFFTLLALCVFLCNTGCDVFPVLEDPTGSPTPEGGDTGGSGGSTSDDPDTPDYRAVFSAYTKENASGSLNTYWAGDGAEATDSDVWISGEFPKFLIKWRAGLKVRTIAVEGLMPVTQNFYGIHVIDDDYDGAEYILSPVVYGAYNIPGTKPWSHFDQPSPRLTIGEGAYNIGATDDTSTLFIKIWILDPTVLNPTGTRTSSIHYSVRDLNHRSRGDGYREQCTRPRECLESGE